jgi:hypothetical protein
VVLIAAGCKHSPLTPAPTPTPTVIEREPISPAHTEASHDCDYDPDPVLVITTTEVLLGGTPEDEAGLRAALRDRQAMYALIGAPPHVNVLLQVTKGVSEKRLARALAASSAAGFTNVTRLPDFDPTQARNKKRRTAEGVLAAQCD